MLPGKRHLRIIFNLALTLIVGLLLTATIYFTQFDPRWVAFLGGILFAAMLALASQVSKSEWLILRRSRQLERMRERLNTEEGRCRAATESARIAQARMRMVVDMLPDLVLYVDADGRCHYHNSALQSWTQRPADEIDGRSLAEIMGETAGTELRARITPNLTGSAPRYDITLPRANGDSQRFSIVQLAYPAQGEPLGLYVVLTPQQNAPADDAAPAADADAGASPAMVVSQDGGEQMYLRSISEELMGEDPRAKLVRALEQDEFLLLAQKILPLKSGLPEPECFEILLRLREEEDNLLPPGGFIPVAEHYGMMEDIDRWVITHLVDWCIQRKEEQPARRIPMFCVNLSEAALRNPDFAKFVAHQVNRRGFTPRALCLEIGEIDVLANHDAACRLVAMLKPLGCRFTLDAFGSARVSFTSLRNLPVDQLKIDGAIIQNILRAPSELAKTRAINTVCAKLGIRTIGEFVESRETLDKLRDIGLDYVQGFGIARPAPLVTAVAA